ncbi:ABC transporter permease [Streptomyces sp. NPDC033538]|uniref:ABC transporter permease n=1 Tax=Streptomyces sp. NPDC033538 TaxID=3155367 RepID=UPI0033F2D1B0
MITRTHAPKVIESAEVIPVRPVWRPWVMVERYLLVNRHAWAVVLAGIVEPVLYLLAMGMGVGTMVGDVHGPGGRPVAYAAFVAPALLATSAMNGSLTDVTNTFFFKLRFGRFYDALITTPMRPMDVALGEILWALLRGGLYAAGFMTVMTVLGLPRSPWFLAAFPAVLLTGWAFAAVGLAVTTYFTSWQQLEYIVLATLPMFFFSTTFYPIDVYPDPLAAVVRCTPLYQSVELLRGLSLGDVGAGLLGNVCYLALMGAVGLVVAHRRMDRLLCR